MIKELKKVAMSKKHATDCSYALWRTSVGGYVCSVPCYIKETCEVRMKIAVLLSNGKVAYRHVNSAYLHRIDSEYDLVTAMRIEELVKIKEHRVSEAQ